MRIVFRTDASLLSGSGHVMRCLTLAEHLAAAGAECIFISRNHPGHLHELVRQRGFRVEALASAAVKQSSLVQNANALTYADWLGCPWMVDAQQSLAVLAQFQADWLVVDHYALDRNWESALRPYCHKLMVIDDLADRAHNCDLLIDQNLGRHAQEYAGLVPAGCTVRAGPEFALLRPEFARWRTRSLERRRHPTLKRLLVSMGGVDQPNATGKVLVALKGCALPRDCKVTVVMGQQALWLPSVRAQAQDMPWPTDVLAGISDMAERMAATDLAIGAAGSTSWERCCLGVPALIIVLAENQKQAAAHLQLAGAAHCLALGRNLPQQLARWISTLADTHGGLEQLSIHASKVTDGSGALRVAAAMETLMQSVI